VESPGLLFQEVMSMKKSFFPEQEQGRDDTSELKREADEYVTKLIEREKLK